MAQVSTCRFASFCRCPAALLLPIYRKSVSYRRHESALQKCVQQRSFRSSPLHLLRQRCLPGHAPRAATCPDLAVRLTAAHHAADERLEDRNAFRSSSSSSRSSVTEDAAEQPPSELDRLVLEGGRMTSIAQAVWSKFVRPGDTVVDATCGNGNDTRWLARAVGPSGRVFAFDIQEEAIRSARAVLEDEVDPRSLPEVQYVQGCHSQMQEHVLSAHFVCFNLGFLPGGERHIITEPATTVAALQAAINILEPRGLISMLCYVGHSGGMEEYEAVRQFALHTHPGKVYVIEQRILNRPLSPVLILFWKKPMPE